MHREGATLAFTYQGEAVKDRVLKLATEFASDLVFPCDVASDDEINQLFVDLGARWDGALDGLVHSIAFVARRWPASFSKACRAKRSGPPTR